MPSRASSSPSSPPLPPQERHCHCPQLKAQVQTYILPNTRKLKFSNLNTSHFSAVDHHFKREPLAINWKDYCESLSKKPARWRSTRYE